MVCVHVCVKWKQEQGFPRWLSERGWWYQGWKYNALLEIPESLFDDLDVREILNSFIKPYKAMF